MNRWLRVGSSGFGKEILFAVFAFAYAFDIAACIMWSCMGDVGFGMIRHQIAGVEATPFQYRILVPWLFKMLSYGKQVCDPYVLDELRTPCTIVSAAAILTYLYATRAMVFHIFGENSRSFALSFVFWLLLPVLYVVPLVQFCFIYDLVGIGFMSLGLLLILKRRWVLYLLMFTVATFNRETTCFLTLFYLALEIRRDSWRRVLGFCVLQGLIWAAIKGYLRAHYADNIVIDSTHCSLFDFRLFTNLGILAGTYSDMAAGTTAMVWFQLAAVFGGIWIAVVMFWSRIKDNRIISRLMLVVPVYVVAILVPGAIEELRIFAEISPVVGLAYCGIILNEGRECGGA